MFSLSKYNPGKSFHGSQRHFPLPEDPFEVWGLDFIQIPPSQENKYVSFNFVRVEAFPCRKETAYGR